MWFNKHFKIFEKKNFHYDLHEIYMQRATASHYFDINLHNTRYTPLYNAERTGAHRRGFCLPSIYDGATHN